MAESKHTPGPWAISPFDAYDKSAVVGTSDGWLAEVQLENLPNGAGKANVCLIAAAPAMLEALERINIFACYASEENTDSREAMLLKIGETARAAIAKAEQGTPKDGAPAPSDAAPTTHSTDASEVV